MDVELEISDEEIDEIEQVTASSTRNLTPKTVFRTKKHQTPGGTCYDAPIVDDKLKPYVGQVLENLDECEKMYNKYALASGFDVRKSTQTTNNFGLVVSKYYVCNRTGNPKPMAVDTLQTGEHPLRRSNMERTGCKAKIKFLKITGSSKYKVDAIQPIHNHELLRPEYKHLSKQERQLKYVEQIFIYNASKANIGATTAHQLYCNMKGCEENVNGTVVDFRNWSRDLNVFISESDSQMLVNKMLERKKYVPGFSFYYKAVDNILHSLFWADEVAKCNYNCFHDVMSFDATYRTNRYNLMFVPFTGIDNHRKCVTFAGGLIRDETTESYIWLLNCFLDAFKKEPIMVVTDQDKSMEKAIKTVFKKAKHRLCMWHITQKLLSKVRDANPSIENELESDFKRRFDSIVWNMHIEPAEFEMKWDKLMNDFSLKNDTWFNYMFEIRSRWIPAYFIDTEMFGLMRTTSRSESENAFFSHFTKSGSNLVNFMSGFESAMFKQRSSQSKLDAFTIKKTRELKTQLKMEKQAANVYIHTMFEFIQEEIQASLYKCMLDQMTKDEQTNTCACVINDCSISSSKPIQYKVLFDQKEGVIICTCKKYLKLGLLCRHCFWVLKNFQINELPKKYIMKRWMKNLIPPELRSRRNIYGDENISVQKLINEATSVIEDSLQ
uniref:protein FAR1-RELATED SEQUENCE 5-like n=1 Tax=Erigeron canadensis TaxID=72917 RepID=UPI001CB95478|nr:protein FAR1-RELATED SEQUENCE 5-like [Erigeron canadensis]